MPSAHAKCHVSSWACLTTSCSANHALTSSDAKCDSIWHIFWHSMWHSIWHIFWHSMWHSFWKSSDILSGISSDILSGISSDILSADILSEISSDILSGRSSDILSGISSDILSGISSDILSGTLFGILYGFVSGRWGPVEVRRPTVLRISPVEARRGPQRSDPCRLRDPQRSPVEVRRGPQRSDPRQLRSGEAHSAQTLAGWSLARTIVIKSLQMRSGEAHCDQELADEVRRGKKEAAHLTQNLTTLTWQVGKKTSQNSHGLKVKSHFPRWVPPTCRFCWTSRQRAVPPFPPGGAEAEAHRTDLAALARGIETAEHHRRHCEMHLGWISRRRDEAQFTQSGPYFGEEPYFDIWICIFVDVVF